jgi:hypothetical protein
MNFNTAAFSADSPNGLNSLRIRRAIAKAQSICEAQGQNSPACELTWDQALTLQVQQCSLSDSESSPAQP